MIEECVVNACAGCYRQRGACGCSRVPRGRTPAELEAELLNRWADGGPTIPEARWLVAYRLDLRLDDVLVRVLGSSVLIVIWSSAMTLNYSAIEPLMRTLRGSCSGFSFHIDVRVAPRRRTG